MVEIKNISKMYGDLKAVNNISINIGKGEVVGLLGPNGAGKSTTMKIISGLIIPDEGDVVINSKSVRDNPIYCKKRIGFMPENNPLYKDLNVKESIEFSLNLSNIAKSLQKERIDYVVKSTGLEKVFYKNVSELSKGFKQRVGLAQVLAADPEILILDEPTEGLDPNQRGEIRALIKELGKDKTVIISTHVLQEVESMCNRIIIINKGEVVQDSSLDDFKKVGSSSVNIELVVKSNHKPNLSLSATQIKLVKSKNSLYTYHISGSNEATLIHEINQNIKKQDIEIFQLNTIQQNLEEIFKNITLNK